MGRHTKKNQSKNQRKQNSCLKCHLMHLISVGWYRCLDDKLTWKIILPLPHPLIFPLCTKASHPLCSWSDFNKWVSKPQLQLQVSYQMICWYEDMVASLTRISARYLLDYCHKDVSLSCFSSKSKWGFFFWFFVCVFVCYIFGIACVHVILFVRTTAQKDLSEFWSNWSNFKGVQRGVRLTSH